PLYSHAAHRDRHSFPTRRSSDLRARRAYHHPVEKTLPDSFVKFVEENPIFRFSIHTYQQIKTLREVAGEIRSLLDGESEDRILLDRKSTRLNSSHSQISYAVFCL